jgi:UDP:flavonoid glycosyltransferase YjiC (YdhE family)
MRVLMLSTPLSTHFTPMVPLAWALRGAGHDVLVAGQPDVTDVAHAAGLTTAVFGDRFHAVDLFGAGLRPGRRPLQEFGQPTPDQLNSTPQVWRNHVSYYLDDYLELARAYRPNLVVSEQMEFSGRVIGAVLGVASLQFRWGVDPYTGAGERLVGLFMGPMCERLGLGGGLPDPDLILDPCPPGLQLPNLPSAQPIRPVPYNGTGPLPDWIHEPKGRAHRVCVSLGNQTLALNGVPLLKNIIAALATLPEVEAIVTAAAGHHAELGEIPANVRVVAPTPLTGFLEGCDAIVHHGGSGTSLAACHAGVRQLVLPQIIDQFATARRLVATGAALALDTAKEQDDPKVLAERLRALLADPGHAEAAHRLGVAARGMPAPAALIPTLEELAA